MHLYRAHVLVCAGTGCTSSNSVKIMEEMETLLSTNKLDKEVQIVKTGCFGLCAEGPIVVVYPEGSMYTRVEVSDVKEIVEEHLLKGRIVKRLLAGEKEAHDISKSLEGVEFFTRQTRISLINF